jgi:serine protease
MSFTSQRRVIFGCFAVAAVVAVGMGGAERLRFEVKRAFTPPANAPEFAPDRVIVKFNPPLAPTEIDAAFASRGATWIESGEDHDFDVLRVEPGTVSEWVTALSLLPGVEYAEPDSIFWATSAPNDPNYQPYEWNFYDWGELSNGVASNFGVQGESAWNTTSGAGVTVAIVDTGVAYENYKVYYQADDLAGATFVHPRDFVNGDYHANDDNSHGTHVCGTVCQTTNNSIGCAGLANACTIMPVKVLDASGSGYLSWVASGIRWAANNGAFAINMSLGGTSGSTTLLNAVNYAWNNGCVLCAAAGNSGTSGVLYPARYVNCIAVGATRFDGGLAYYSSYGPALDVVAPGGDTTVDQNGDGYGDGILQETFSGGYNNFGYYFFEGTSMATPHVTATAALVKANKSQYTNVDVRAAIETKTKDLGAPGKDNKFGNGLVSAVDALTY